MFSLIGGTYNHNNKGQQHHVPITDERYRFGIKGISDDMGASRLVVAFEFFGVEDLVIRDITIRNQRAWSMMCVNFKNVTMENIYRSSKLDEGPESGRPAFLGAGAVSYFKEY
jgi:polygalacturonase